MLNVHLRGTFLMSREAGRAMLAQRSGSIVNIGSIAGLAGIPTRNAYGAAKAGIAAMTRAMACEWARSGVRVNAVAPGYVRTALVERLEREGALDIRAIDARTPMGRMAEPSEIAEAIAFLASRTRELRHRGHAERRRRLARARRAGIGPCKARRSVSRAATSRTPTRRQSMLIHLFNGLVYGALLIVMCSGLALIYGLRRVVNFAHGALYMLGAYIGYSVALHSNFWVALVAAPAVMALLGVLLDRWGFRLLQDRDPLSVVLVTFGLLLMIEDFVQTVWGKSNLSVVTPAAARTSRSTCWARPCLPIASR